MKNVEIAQWLNGLPLAPEFRPTDTEFSDPIAYISKIEKEASSFGICKVIPPFSKPSKKYVLHNLNKSLTKCPELGLDVKVCSDKGNEQFGESRAVFTTRCQELGQSEKKKTNMKMKGMSGSLSFEAQKKVWQSGEVYTLEQFEAKSKSFARKQLGTVKDVSPLVVETMFWKAVSQKSVYVEYANDVPGSGFGEPEGVSNIYRKKRRRKKREVFDRSHKKTCDNKKEGLLGSNSIDKQSFCVSPDICKVSPSDCSASSQPNGLCDSNDVEGSAGWKLSNSPWNLQVIARSPGSLTRYMPDDIPGVTSPMVYIGMLFSWFAWHVEDHELHSLNFLHTGSPKTWYAVAGDYASKFEEVVRVQAYGDSTDPLAALTLLGEKTTLLSPEVIVSSGIPCCRLVQYPGEFVVTFPRAYHVGFSHGFNCGEAANFGTPQWLTVAKDAAVRRAAMNYLPMLSHQQLLYLLTMSFVSRVPKSLLPGVRSSRLRDRQKEERETLVKKAFVGDVLKENELVTILLQKHSSYQAVLWDVDMLPSASERCELQKCVGTDLTKKCSDQNDDKYNSRDILNKMNSYLENLSDLCAEDEDLSNEFQVDTGALPCIACGILGFPFMAVVQPSEKSIKNFYNHHTIQCMGELKSFESRSHPQRDSIVFGDVAGDRSMPPERLLLHLKEVSCAESGQSTAPQMKGQFPLAGPLSASNPSVDLEDKWDTYNTFLRPQILCIEHAIQTEELLHRRGGAKVLVICHSDFQKIRAYATFIAEETDTTFVYNEIVLDNASKEHLQLIDLAIEDGYRECAEDWTSTLHINLLHSMKKLSKNSCQTAKKLEYALILSRLFPDTTTSSMKCLGYEWESRKVRSKRRTNPKPANKLCVPSKFEEKCLESKLDNTRASREETIAVQYSRKRFKLKPRASLESDISTHEISSANEKLENLIPQMLAMEDRSRNSHINDSPDVTSFVKSPCEGLRPRASKKETSVCTSDNNTKNNFQDQRNGGPSHRCDIEGCKMSFKTKREVSLHKRNRCPVNGCGKKFNCHRYAVRHQRVHEEDRPLKCSWEGCSMSFKWSWARTEHLRVHTGERPYKCKFEGCGLSFRFVSDFSRHRRKTGHHSS
ncbi:unnamed protein product [Cuscuta europaea]|uniref:Lysine-specific demethylase ELF6 n=2 Tax=Cuscuta europaea TaxID=41803 RepID=A0A9P0ZXJ1_CUSEU|nr:unnamed protein product [Cuscuta europaea]